MKQVSPPERNFRSLSVKDLLEAREAYHIHLTSKENVVATAIGRFRIRISDPDARAGASHIAQWRPRDRNVPARTLQNTIVKEYSWPCVLVFVDQWVQQHDIVSQNPDQVVPRFLYMPDGRVVPTCVILAERYTPALPPLRNLAFPDQLIGGGYPVFSDEQGQEHIGSLGCLVSDGDIVYALTNRHVAGDEGRPIYTMLHGQKVQIGVSARSGFGRERQVGKRLFKDVYPGWPGSHSFVNLDAGLIRVDDLDYWTAQVFGIGELADPLDLNTDSISLDLIGCPVRAFGGASGELSGEIQALFYRYKSIGGAEYISDLLIGPRADKPLNTHPGDSGTLWFVDPPSDPGVPAPKQGNGRAQSLRPLALQWGGQTVIDGQGRGKLQFALATCLSTICRELDVDIIPDWNTGHSEYWGKTGHYKIAAAACQVVDTPDPSLEKLKTLLMNNVSVIAFDDQAIQAGELQKIDSAQFVPLADVPDLVWRNTRKLDSANHFADMDQPGQADFAGKTLLDLCRDPKNLSIEVWNDFYASLQVAPLHRGGLPFRVWQIYDHMVQFVRAGKVAEFICAGGVMSHYVGDACQPLHVSYLHHGHPDIPAEIKVHSIYETAMLDRYATELIGGVNASLAGRLAQADVQGGFAASLSVLALMRSTIEKLPPEQVINAFNAESAAQRLPYMWSVLKDATAACMAEGCLRLASLWASAWQEGGGMAAYTPDLGMVDRSALKALYDDNNFLPAYRLSDPAFAAELT
ncbi:MAG: hypothetical protein WCE68_00515 [Anaerolineales bacterium]